MDLHLRAQSWHKSFQSFSQLQFKLYHEVLKNMAQNSADAFLPKAWNIQEVKSSCIFPIVSLKWYQLHLMRGEMVLP